MSNFQLYTGDSRVYPTYGMLLVSNGAVVDFAALPVPPDGRWSATSGPATVTINPSVTVPVVPQLAVTSQVYNPGTGAPTTGSYTVGELSVDSAGAEYVCTASGTPGTWLAMSGGGTSLPTQTGNSGKYLTTDGSAASWATVSAAASNTIKAWNVQDAAYGAVGNGTTDDRAAIQSAVNACSTAGGGIVFLPAATYKIGSPGVAPRSNVTMFGPGANLVPNFAGAAIASDGTTAFSNFTVDSLTFTGTVNNTVSVPTRARTTSGTGATNGIFIQGSLDPTGTYAAISNVVIKNCTVNNTTWMPVRITGISGQLLVTGCRFYNSQDAVGGGWCTDVQVTNNYSYMSSDNGFSLARTATKVVVANNTVELCAYAGISLAGFAGYGGAFDFAITGNVIRNPGAVGISVTDNARNGVVSGNFIDKGFYKGPSDGPDDSHGVGIQLADNVFSEGAQWALSMPSSAPTAGTFTMTYNGTTVTGIPWNVTAAQITTFFNAALAGGGYASGGGFGLGSVTARPTASTLGGSGLATTQLMLAGITNAQAALLSVNSAGLTGGTYTVQNWQVYGVTVSDNTLYQCPRAGITYSGCAGVRISNNNIVDVGSQFKADGTTAVASSATNYNTGIINAISSGNIESVDVIISGNSVTDNRTTPYMNFAFDPLVLANAKCFNNYMGAGGRNAPNLPVPVQSTLTANTQTASYTLTLSDAGGVVEMNVAGANTLTIPPNSSVAFPLGTLIEVFELGAGVTTITPGAGVTIDSAGSKVAISAQYVTVGLRKRGTNEWVLVGSLA